MPPGREVRSHYAWQTSMAVTEKHIDLSGIDIYRIANGQIAEHWHEMYALSMLQ